MIFALKVLTTHYWPQNEDFFIMNVSINPKYIVWVELIWIQLLTPRASFVGHLAGILVGFAYVNGLLKPIIDLPFCKL